VGQHLLLRPTSGARSRVRCALKQKRNRIMSIRLGVRCLGRQISGAISPPPNAGRHKSPAGQVSRKRSSLEQSFAAALALGRGPAARKRPEQAKQLP
jgi:hypothetical protein